MFLKFKQWLCGLVDHPGSMIQYEADRVYTICPNCGLESPGWELPDGPMIPKFVLSTFKPSLE